MHLLMPYQHCSLLTVLWTMLTQPGMTDRLRITRPWLTDPWLTDPWLTDP